MFNEINEIEETKDDMFEILINKTYGSFRISKKGLDLYNEKMKKNNPDFKEIKSYFRIKRHDPILIKVFNELQNEFNDEHSMIYIEKIQKKHINYYSIKEYDGLEWIEIDYDRYNKDQIKKIIENENINNETKIEQIYKIVNK